jgi:uncharacterized repeat protein (TIGR03837 family)
MPVAIITKTANKTAQRWVIFCRVIDNFGDAGVCWRLARQLATEFSIQIDLVIDRPDLLTALEPDHALLANNIQIWDWHPTQDQFPSLGDVTIAAFGCQLPPNYRKLLNGIASKRWFNLEYLSAQPWVDSIHLMASKHAIDTERPAILTDEIFFFPGFSPASGSLLREASMPAPALSSEQRAQLLSRYGADPKSKSAFIFCYPNAPIDELINAIAQQGRDWNILLAGQVLPSNSNISIAGKNCEQANFCIVQLPFVSQTEFDQLLAACDLNFVRGEDSWIRAIWANKPFIWQAYPQDKAEHLNKLSAFMDRFLTHTDPLTGKAVLALAQWWNGQLTESEPTKLVNQALAHYEAWAKASQSHCDALRQLPDLATQLVRATV